VKALILAVDISDASSKLVSGLCVEALRIRWIEISLRELGCG
jgi:hypothetical protein